MKRWILILTFLFLAIPAKAELKVVSLNPLLSDLVRQIGGTSIQVTDLLPMDSDPHAFVLTPADFKQLQGADILLASGLGLESYLNSLQANLDPTTKLFIAGEIARPLLSPSHLAADHEPSHRSMVNPHWWHSVKVTEYVVNKLGELLMESDSEHCFDYKRNMEAYLEKLKELDRWIRVELTKIPRSQRILVTSHYALEYFAKEHGFRILAVEGLSSSDQPSSKSIRALIQDIQQSQAKALFLENIQNPKVLKEITQETGIQPGGTLYADGLSQHGATTYLDMMRRNVETLVKALQ